MVDRRWLWTVPMYLVLGFTFLVALHSALRPPGVASGQPFLSQDEPPRERRQSGAGSLIDLEDFKFLHLLDRCNSSRLAPSWVGLVSSAPHHYRSRRDIRNSWGVGQQVVFLLGKANSTLQPLIEREAREFGDIVQGNFVDSYRNLTYKHAMGLLWAGRHCPSASYILKTDDDVFVNTAYLESHLQSLPGHGLILCPLMKASKAQRSYRSKWRVTPGEYPRRWYPPYCAGWVILYSPDVTSALFSLAQKEPYFWIDDVHITGTLAEKLNVTHTPLGKLGLLEVETESLLSGENHDDFLFSLTFPKNFQKLRALVNEVPSTDV